MQSQKELQASLAEYQALSGHFDAFSSSFGKQGGDWRPLVQWIEDAGQEGLDATERQLRQLIRENGATFSVDDSQDETDRPWNLAPIPMLIDCDSWQSLISGLEQRNRILEATLDDLLGAQSLIKAGIIPPDLLWMNPAFRRAYVGLPVAKIGGRTNRLTVTATDLTRGSDGSWLVVGDRTRAPSGLGYLLENRITTNQVVPKLIRNSNVRRLASFFSDLRETLRSLAPRMRDNPRVALLTPGPKSYRYFEDAYLARYLGYTLVQGSDLAVRSDRLNLKTLGGLLPIEVLWRHVSDRKCDPLELDPTSVQGVTGLMRTVRDQSIAVVNALGSEIAQMPALAAFLPKAANHFFGEDLELRTIETRWCGNSQDLEYVLNNLNQFAVRNAFEIDRTAPVDLSRLNAEELGQWGDRLKSEPQKWVAQRNTNLWTTPVWADGMFAPWHVSLRSFQLSNADSVQVLPGGLARVGPSSEHLLGSPVSGDLTIDCWVTDSKSTTNTLTLLTTQDDVVEPLRVGDELPSRVAEHLFWLGRYVERCESVARLLRTTLKRMVAEENQLDDSDLPQLTAALAAVGQLPPDYAIDGLGNAFPSLESVLPESVFSMNQPDGLAQATRSVLFNATAVRDRLSIDAYRILQRVAGEFEFAFRQPSGAVGPALERLNRLIIDLLAFAGLSSESMTRTHGWRFLQLGRRLERTLQTAELLSATLSDLTPNERLLCESILETTESKMTYRSRYMNLVRAQLVIDLLVADPTNPRSICYQVFKIEEALARLPRTNDTVALEEDQKIAKRLLHLVEMINLADMTSPQNGRRVGLADLLAEITSLIPKLSDAIAAHYFFHTNTTQSLTGSGAGI
ncbi:MAG: circularly permuted type 2 ATP-grasp protein [Aureliella sp.]